MARPLSEEKRDALLEAASDLIAQLGTGASTAKIAKAAGVSEGTLFTYFPSKDDLLNDLFVEIEAKLAETMLAPYPMEASARNRLFIVWSRLIEWGLNHSTARKALRQLKVSDRVTAESRKRCHSAPERVAFYIDTILFDLADITMNAIAAKPKEREAIRQAGFDLFWKGSAA